MRRKLPLGREHLIALAEWIASGETLSDYHYPLNAFVKVVETFGRVDPTDQTLHSSLERVVKALRQEHSKEAPKLAQRIEVLLTVRGELAATPSTSAVASRSGPDPCKPAPVGSAEILVELKQFLGILPENAEVRSETVGYDRFPLRKDSPR